MATSDGDFAGTKTKSKITNQLTVETLFQEAECRPIIRELEQCGCCDRCILRLIGVKRQPLYSNPQQVVSQLLGADQNDDSCGCATLADQPSKHDGKSQDPANEMPRKVCSVCLGILQELCDNKHVETLAKQVQQADFGFENFSMSLAVPLQLLIREHCIYLHLKSVFGKLYQNLSPTAIATIKEVYKWVCGPIMGNALDVRFHFKSPMEIMVTFTHKETEVELNKLLQQGRDDPPPRKRSKFQFTNTSVNSPGRPVVMDTIKDLPSSQFKELFPCPPLVPDSPCCTEVTCSYSAVFVAGRYNKYSRKLSQTPWLIAGERKTESSVQEIVCNPIQELFQASDIRFSASGREDVDVRTLGNGRPFVIEILNSRRPIPSQKELTALQKKINKSNSDVHVRDLQCIEREDTNKLKDGEEIKTKSYSALVWSAVEQTTESLAFLQDIKDLTLQQKTPIRVLHRRALATRERSVHSLSANVIDAHHFKLFLRTQAGTYIKEFVHGDFGRTTPSLGTLLKCDVDILELDVESVDVDWPPSLPDEDIGENGNDKEDDQKATNKLDNESLS